MNAAEVLKTTNSDMYTKSIRTSDVDLLNIVKQVCELTGCSHDVAATALFDCNYDLERALDKIFEHPVETTVSETAQISNVWKEVAKSKKKATAAEVVQPEINVTLEIDTIDNKSRSTRGTSRGRARNVRGTSRTFENNVRGRGRRPPMRVISNRGRLKARYNQNYEPEAVSNEWLSDDIEPETESLAMLSVTEDVLNPVEIVAKYSKKDGVFGDYSRTKAPPRSSFVDSNQPIRLVTNNGVKSTPSMRAVFNFGLDFTEYCENVGCDDVAEQDDNRSDVVKVRVGDNNDIRRVLVDESSVKRGNVDDISISRRVQECITSSPDHKLQCLPDTSYTPLLPASSLCPPPGMSNAHILQQIQSNPQHYLSLLNVANAGQSLFDLTESAGVVSSSNNEANLLHSIDSKEFLQKSALSSTSSSSTQDNSVVLNAMQMSNICCFPPIYMNNFANFLPSAQQSHNSSVGQSVEANSKSLYSSQMNYDVDDDSVVSGVKQHKYGRGGNYVPNYGKEDDGDKSSKIAVRGRPTQGPSQSVTNDPRYLAFHHHQQQQHQQQHQQHHHQSHPGYANNIYNCVTAPNPHPSGAPHPYAMAHHASIPQLHPQQLHMMQQQMQHNFPPSYQYQEHLMTSMVPNATNRNVSGSSGNPTRNGGGRSNNALWNPSN